MPIFNVNNQAARKLDHVAERFAAALRISDSVEKYDVLSRRLWTADIPEFECIVLTYIKRQRLFASLFDLNIIITNSAEASPELFSLEAGSSLQLEKCISLEKGLFAAKNHAYRSLAANMNCTLAQERIKDIGVFDLSLDVAADYSWRIVLQQMVGSSTWNLIPPIMQLVDPHEEDCIKTIELLRMFAAASRSALYSQSYFTP